jgi:triacylglycerol lipase
VLLHGLCDTARLFKRLRKHLESGGWEVHVPEFIPNNGTAGLEVLAQQVHDFIARTFAPGQAIDLIGFSMGGIVGRYYLQRIGGLSRVHRFVTISSPHRGTWTAYLLQRKGVRQMRPNSVFLKDLDSDYSSLEKVRFTSIWTPTDLMIIPAMSSVIPQAKTVRIVVTHHGRMAGNERVMRAVEAGLL